MSKTGKEIARQPKGKAPAKAKALTRQQKGKDLAASKVDRWSVEGMTATQAEESKAKRAEIEARPFRPRIKTETNSNGACAINAGDPSVPGSAVLNSVRIFHASGSSSVQFVGDLMLRVGEVLTLTDNHDRNECKVGAAFAMIAAIDPQDELEATMALQMVAANESALTFFRRAARSDYIEHASAYSNMANKAMRSFALHAEALAKLRRGGEQVVKHVHVNEGGQAVIANNVTTGGGQRE